MEAAAQHPVWEPGCDTRVEGMGQGTPGGAGTTDRVMGSQGAGRVWVGRPVPCAPDLFYHGWTLVNK